MTLGHEGDHQNGQHIWHQAQGNYQSTNLAGASYEDLIRDLFRRVEQLEQTSAGGAAVDDMFAAQARKHSHLAQSVGELSGRVRGLEQAQVYGPGPHDLSALQASITNHVNRALTEFGSQLGIILDGMRDVLSQHISTNTTAVLARLAPEPPVFCGEPDLAGLYHCEKEPDHDGRHQSGNMSWPNPCGATHSPTGATCIVVKGHTTEHRSDLRAGSGRLRWTDLAMTDIGVVTEAENKAAAQALGLDYLPPDGADDLTGHPEECHGEVCVKSEPEPVTHVDTGLDYTTERASASPAAVRCPAQFREGQCLGYAGHDGECSALPDPREPQLENPGESTEEDNHPEQNFHS